MKKFTVWMVIGMVAFLTAACAQMPLFSVPDQFKPMPWIFKQVPQDASASVKKGWIDGCESGLASMTNSFYRSFYRFQQDPALRKDPDYYRTWKDVFTYCRHYAYGTLRQANARMALANSRSGVFNRIGGQQNWLDTGMLNMWGPGSEGQWFQNFGDIGGDPYLSPGLANVLDFRGDMYLGKPEGNPSLDWDFRGTAPASFLKTTIDLKEPDMKTLTLQPMDPQ
jgi:hypothetical protein